YMLAGKVGGVSLGVLVGEWLSHVVKTDVSALSGCAGIIAGWCVAWMLGREIPNAATCQVKPVTLPPDASQASRRRTERLQQRAPRRPLGRAGDMALAPLDQLSEDGFDVAPPRGRVVLLARRMILVPLPLDQAAALEPRQPFRQDVAGD